MSVSSRRAFYMTPSLNNWNDRLLLATLRPVPFLVFYHARMGPESACLCVMSLIAVSCAPVNPELKFVSMGSTRVVTVEGLKCSFDILNAIVWGKSSACGFPTDGTLDELDYRRDHLVHRANSLEECISFSGCGH